MENQSAPAQYVFLTCQRGAESALRREMERRRPDYRFSYSRPGFATWRRPSSESLEKRLAFDASSLQLVFARSYSHFVGRVSDRECAGDDGSFDQTAAIARVWDLVRSEVIKDAQLGRREPLKIARIHVYERDRAKAGFRGYEPCLAPSAFELHRKIYDAAPTELRENFGADADRLDAPGKPGEICLDVATIEKNEWYVGVHRVTDMHSQYPGGLLSLSLPTDAASRAFLKYEEGLRWSKFPIGVGSHCVDVGAAPGGGSQALLARGAFVLGVDPAQIDPRVLEHPNFTHLRGKIGQLKRRRFRKSRWFVADMNVMPNYTLDVLEEIIHRGDIPAQGALFTLKFSGWKFADEIPEYLSRVKSWGFNRIWARQLQFNRQEIMVAALK
ncbi:MAG: SAM-dependent methyltransferase [Thermoguttaceae bacterium]